MIRAGKNKIKQGLTRHKQPGQGRLALNPKLGSHSKAILAKCAVSKRLCRSSSSIASFCSLKHGCLAKALAFASRGQPRKQCADPYPAVRASCSMEAASNKAKACMRCIANQEGHRLKRWPHVELHTCMSRDKRTAYADCAVQCTIGKNAPQ